MPFNQAEPVIEKEVKNETNLSCGVETKITEVSDQPQTGVHCYYYALRPSKIDVLENRDPDENEEVEWVPILEAIKRIGSGLNQDVEAYLATHTR